MVSRLYAHVHTHDTPSANCISQNSLTIISELFNCLCCITEHYYWQNYGAYVLMLLLYVLCFQCAFSCRSLLDITFLPQKGNSNLLLLWPRQSLLAFQLTAHACSSVTLWLSHSCCSVGYVSRPFKHLLFLTSSVKNLFPQQ